MAGGAKVVVEPHRFAGVFVARGKEDALVTLNLNPGKAVYGEKLIKVDGAEGVKTEYRVWNPFRSKLAAAVLGGVENIYMVPGAKVLYLGAASGTSVSHVSDLVGPVRTTCNGRVPHNTQHARTTHHAAPHPLPLPLPPPPSLQTGMVYAVEFSHRSGRDLINMAKTRPNVIPIIEDARHPLKYRMLVGMVDVVFADVAQPDQARIIALNAQYFLKSGGHYVISIKANCIDSTAPAEVVFAKERQKLAEEGLKPLEQLTLEPYERDHAVVTGVFRAPAAAKKA